MLEVIMRLESSAPPCYENTLFKRACCATVGVLGVGLAFSSIVVPTLISQHNPPSPSLNSNRVIASFVTLAISLVIIIFAVAKFTLLCATARDPATPFTSFRRITQQ